jgi:hypothetical protein
VIQIIGYLPARRATVTGTTANMTMIDQLTEHDRTALLSTRAGGVGTRAAKHNEGGFRMAWEKLRRLALVRFTPREALRSTERKGRERRS